MHSIVKNANLCLEPNGFISYLLKKRMNKNTLLQGIEDYQGFNDYWIFALAKTHPARQSWSFQKEQGCPSPRGWGEAQDCYCSNCHHPWGMAFENGTSFRGMERHKPQQLLQSILSITMAASISRRAEGNLQDQYPTCSWRCAPWRSIGNPTSLFHC